MVNHVINDSAVSHSWYAEVLHTASALHYFFIQFAFQVFFPIHEKSIRFLTFPKKNQVYKKSLPLSQICLRASTRGKIVNITFGCICHFICLYCCCCCCFCVIFFVVHSPQTSFYWIERVWEAPTTTKQKMSLFCACACVQRILPAHAKEVLRPSVAAASRCTIIAERILSPRA